MSKATTSVIIVGAGPVGLGLACELGQRGVDCILVEKRDGAITVPKQSMVSSRNMEFCRRWGIAQTVRTAVWPESFPRDFVYLESLRGRELLRFKVPAYAQRSRSDFTPETACPCPQIYFDPILSSHARKFPNVTLRYHCQLDRFEQDADGVSVQVTEGWARFYRPIDETGCWSELIPIDGKELWRLTVFDRPLSAADPDFLLRKLAVGVALGAARLCCQELWAGPRLHRR
jgi:2-polyprenyl-6-methoxyphenol hydroxylase-like FAD-dependent oxidoreductase